MDRRSISLRRRRKMTMLLPPPAHPGRVLLPRARRGPQSHPTSICVQSSKYSVLNRNQKIEEHHCWDIPASRSLMDPSDPSSWHKGCPCRLERRHKHL